MIRKKCILVVLIAAWTSCPQLTLAGTPDAGRPIPGAPPSTSDVAEPLSASIDSVIPFSHNPSGIRCGAVGPFLPLFMVAVLSLSGKLPNHRRRDRFDYVSLSGPSRRIGMGCRFAFVSVELLVRRR